jgi:hypothetical protein
MLGGHPNTIFNLGIFLELMLWCRVTLKEWEVTRHTDGNPIKHSMDDNL